MLHGTMYIRRRYPRISGYLLATGLVLAVALACAAIREELGQVPVALLLLIPVGLSTAFWGLGPGLAAGFVGFIAFNYLFTIPYYTLYVHRPADLVVLIIFLIVAIVISQLIGRAEAGREAAAARERQATQLYELSVSLAGLRDPQAIGRVLVEQLHADLGAERTELALTSPQALAVHLPEAALAPGRPPELSLPLQATQQTLGEIRLWRSAPPLSPSDQRLARTCAAQGALALERAALSLAESRARLLEESDRFKSALLSSVSHELRTPLSTIKAAASSLRGGQIAWESPARAELLAAIDDEADQLNSLVGNLLDMTRIESGALRPQRQWNVLAEIVARVLTRARSLAASHTLEIDIPQDLPLVPVDFVQMEQVFRNLVSNGAKYAPPSTAIRIRAQVQSPSELLVEVSNQGPHVPEEHLERIFDKFYRITAADRVTGTGLGLSICKGIIEAHGGRIWAVNLEDGFAFRFVLPLTMDGASPLDLKPEPETS